MNLFLFFFRAGWRERTSALCFMKREDIAAGSRVARIRRDGRLAHPRDTPNPPARPARSPRSAPRRGLSHDSRQISRQRANWQARSSNTSKIPATDATDSPQTLTTSPYTTHAHTQDWWMGHRDHVVNHHAMEDRTLHPYVRSRVHVPVEFQASHDQLACMVRTVNRAICNRHFTRASELVLVWHGYRTSLYPLLAEEEAILIPLTRAYFTPEEYGTKIGEILRSTPKLAMGSLLHHLQGGKEGAMGFLVRYGFEWTAWYSWAHAARTQYRENMESKLASLLVGAPVTRRHKDDLRILKTLKPLELNRRLMLSPMASADVSALVFSQMATGRWLLDVEWGFSQMDGVDTTRVVQAERERLII